MGKKHEKYQIKNFLFFLKKVLTNIFASDRMSNVRCCGYNIIGLVKPRIFYKIPLASWYVSYKGHNIDNCILLILENQKNQILIKYKCNTQITILKRIKPFSMYIKKLR